MPSWLSTVPSLVEVEAVLAGLVFVVGTEALSADPEVAGRIDRATIERLTSPGNYLGQAPQMVDRVIASVPRTA